MKRGSSYIVAFVATILLSSPGLAREEIGHKAGSPSFSGMAKSLQDEVAYGPASTTMNINNYSLWVRRDGYFPYSQSPNGCVGNYPIGTANIIYGEGILWGAKVDDGGTTRVRVNGSTYAVGVKAGKVLYNTSGDVVGSEDPNSRHAWRVRRDYETADLTSDAAHYEQILVASVTQADIDGVYDQYDYDWNNWPADEGAPFEDLDGDGIYTPATWDTSTSSWVNGDIPGEPGATQTIWLVANDLPSYWDDATPTPNFIPDPTAVGAPAVAETSLVSTVAYGSPPIGVEMQMTIWGYDYAPTHPLGNMVFKRARMIYTGLPGGPADAVLDTCYFTQWSDPDLGTYTDDYVGCDVGLSLGYVYNGNATDGTYLGNYGYAVPAAGYDFLQGPIVNGDTLGMTSFTYFGAGSAIDDPDLGEYEGTLQFFNLMEGFLPRPAYPNQSDWNDPTTGSATKFTLDGDPVTGVGWVDGIQLPPGDRRLVMTTGPFVMALGDTQDVVLASVAGMGQDNISSVTVLKFYDTFAQYAYDNDFILPSPPPTPSVEATGLDGRIILNWGENTSDYIPTETHESFGFVFEGYNVYQLPTSTSGLAEAEKVATFDEINLIQSIFDPDVDPNSGFVTDQLKQQGTNSGVQRYFSTNRDAVRDRPMSNGNPYYYAVTAYSYLTDNIGSPFKTLESSPNVIAVFPDVPLPGNELGEDYGEGQITTTHSGTADGEVEVFVVSPPDLVGADYEVFFNAQHYYRDVDGIWKETNYPDSVGKNLDKGMDVSASTVTVAALAAEDVGTVDLTFTFELESATGEWVDGFRLDLPDDLTINSATATGTYCSYGAYGQLCENIPDGLIHPGTNTIMWGDSSRSGFGGIEGDMTFTVNVDLFTFPMTAVYQVYDDGYGTATVDAIGTITATELGYEFLTLEHWNLKNLTTGEVVLEDMAFMDGEDIYDGDYGDDSFDSEFIGIPAGPIVEGLQINVSVGYAAPEDFGTLTEDGDGDYDIDSYLANNWAASALASDPDTWGCGTDDIGILQRDLEVRFTGVYADPETTVTGVDTLIYHPIEDGTGSIATMVGARLYDLDVHPLNPSPGTDAHFTVRIPFEVWDLDADGGPEQIDIIIYDREQEPSGAGGGFAGDFYAFNPAGRMYCHFLHRPYSEDVADVGEEGGLDDAGAVACGTEGDLLSWNTVWWEADWVTGDVLTFQYDNPIQLGTDVWTFSTTAPTLADEDLAKEAVEMINVYPNPYYGFHALETSRQGKWVKFNHLPPASISEVTVRIFDLGGAMVRVLHKDDETQYLQWNLRNQSGYPVASGIYLVHIDLPDLGKSKVLKLAIVQEEQVLSRY